MRSNKKRKIIAGLWTRELPKCGCRSHTITLWPMERSSILSAKFDCLVARRDLFSLHSYFSRFYIFPRVKCYHTLYVRLKHISKITESFIPQILSALFKPVLNLQQSSQSKPYQQIDLKRQLMKDCVVLGVFCVANIALMGIIPKVWAKSQFCFLWLEAKCKRSGKRYKINLKKKTFLKQVKFIACKAQTRLAASMSAGKAY